MNPFSEVANPTIGFNVQVINHLLSNKKILNEPGWLTTHHPFFGSRTDWPSNTYRARWNNPRTRIELLSAFYCQHKDRKDLIYIINIIQHSSTESSLPKLPAPFSWPALRYVLILFLPSFLNFCYFRTSFTSLLILLFFY